MANPREPVPASLARHGHAAVDASQVDPAKLPLLSVPASPVSPVIAVKLSAL